ncbi:predicted protein [Naegleria gruberi]|uniref:Predicted protein n=1 Tax=Naegleria gruberi TaxID=5762 RepID=D2V8F1_NAEGR|nr:uncharacterized protein NAEGRDRAFT_47503 [Naegleria gruberi]EFC46796.1 predicted protein [Naegleria gruberi]|eukprot:XP_002679540.1 predicted protein [Naegleria gruberi strain NEG-M]
MPKHNPKEYIKDNSHMSYIQDQERNNPNIHRYTEMMYYDYSYFLDVIRRAVPVALILYSEEERKFIFHTSLREVCPRNSFPRYILVHLQETEDYRSRSRFGLIRLGKLGSILDKSKCVPLKIMENVNGEMVRRDDSYYEGEPVISIQECSNSTCLELVYSDFYWLMRLKIELCQEDIENTMIHSKQIGDTLISAHIPYNGNTAFESTSISPQINRNGRTNILYNSQFRYNPYGLQSNICFFQYENEVQTITDTIEAKGCVSGQSSLLVNQNSNDIFIMNYGGKKHGFYKVTPSTKMEFSDSIIPHQIDQVPFENYDQFMPYDENNSVITCPLTDTKYLIFISTNTQQRTTTYQTLFTKRIIWLLVDLNERRVKRVYPRVYDLANLTSKSDDFITVKKKVRRGRIGNDTVFPDGDLNGGYSDPALLSEIKPSNIHSSDLKDYANGSSSLFEPLIDQKPTSLIPYPEKCKLANTKLFSFRPFPENPELFQVHFCFPETHVILNYLLSTVEKIHTHGQSFRFYFKFRDEATKYAKLLILSKERQFSDISIKTH